MTGACAPAAVETAAGPPQAADGAWSFVVLPDTQKYAARYPQIFASQTRWIADNADTMGIRFAVHVGDIVDVNTIEQWQVASASLRALDDRVPYVLAPGNHDYEGNGKRRETMLNDFFEAADLMAGALDAGAFEPPRVDNNYRVVDTPSGPWLLLALEFGPRDEVIAWADDVLARHRDVPSVVATHAYLYSDSTRYDRQRRPNQRWSPYDYDVANHRGGVNDGADLWNKLIQHHDNVVFVFSGHVLGGGLGRLSSTRATGTEVHQLVANYQMREHGGAGYLRVVQVDPTTHTARVRTYSPHLDRSMVSAENDFALDLRPTLAVR